jgi:predicted S18 family serine protease
MENSELISQNQYLEDAVKDYQQKVRSYQAEVHRLRQLANLTSDNSTVLLRTENIRMVVPAVMAEVQNIWGRPRITGYIGIATNLTLEAVYGQGRVLVNTIPPMGEVFQDTAVTAKDTAERLTGKSLFDYDLIFSIEAPDVVPSVDGPSAGAAMTLMVLSLLEEKSLDPEVSLTGTISPDGEVGAIGGAVEKAIAAEEAGAHIFCIPRANEYTQVTYEREVQVGPFVWKMPYTRNEKTKSLIEERTDLNVVIVEDVLDLIEIATYKDE